MVLPAIESSRSPSRQGRACVEGVASVCVCVCVCVCVRARARVPADCRSPPRWALACAEGDGLRGGLHAVAADAQLPVVVVPPARQQRAGVDAAEDQGEGPCVCVRARSPSLPLSLFSPPPRLAASHSRSAPVHSCGSCARALSPSVSVESDLSVRGDRGTEIQCRFLPLPLAFESVIFVSLSPSVSLSLSPSPCLLSFCRSHPLARAARRVAEPWLPRDQGLPSRSDRSAKLRAPAAAAADGARTHGSPRPRPRRSSHAVAARRVDLVPGRRGRPKAILIRRSSHAVAASPSPRVRRRPTPLAPAPQVRAGPPCGPAWPPDFGRVAAPLRYRFAPRVDAGAERPSGPHRLVLIETRTNFDS